MYTIKAARNAGELSIQSPLSAEDALTKALELRDKGYRSIKLTKEGARVGIDLEQFILNHSAG